MSMPILKGDTVLKEPVTLLTNQNLVHTSSNSLSKNDVLGWSCLEGEEDPGDVPPFRSKPLNTQGLRLRRGVRAGEGPRYTNSY